MFALKLTTLLLFITYSQAKLVGTIYDKDSEYSIYDYGVKVELLVEVTNNEVLPCKSGGGLTIPCLINYEKTSSVQYVTTFIADKDYDYLDLTVDQNVKGVENRRDSVNKLEFIDENTNKTVSSLKAGKKYIFRYTYAFWSKTQPPKTENGEVDVVQFLMFWSGNNIVFSISVHFKILNLND